MLIAVAAGVGVPMWRVQASPNQKPDHSRYLWDGAVTASGLNPYRHAPETVVQGTTGDPTFAELGRRGAPTLRSINHPRLQTIYPPLAQVLFACAYWLGPFN